MPMDISGAQSLQEFKNQVALKFQLYNSLFTSLPFHRIEKTGILLSLLLTNCEEGYKKKLSPVDIIEQFFQQHTGYASDRERIDLLFRFIQYTERQVVLFDSLEDSAFRKVNDLNGPGTLKHLLTEVEQATREKGLADMLQDFAVRIVLTAHPTQFYPGSVLGIINDLGKAIAADDVSNINLYLQQLGKTPFFKKQKPTPYDEAVSLIWYLVNVFYTAAGNIVTTLKNNFPEAITAKHPVIQLGFWPGGDRDGNPFVTSDTTHRVAEALRTSALKNYYLEVRKLKRRLTFKGVDVLLNDLEKKFYDPIFQPDKPSSLTPEEVLQTLDEVRSILIHQHNGLFLSLVDQLISKVTIFGFYFAALDIRQDNSIHHKVLSAIAAAGDGLPKDFDSLAPEARIEVLSSVHAQAHPEKYEGIIKDTLETIHAIRTIQRKNGEAGCSRYVISQCTGVLDVMAVYGLFALCGWNTQALPVDIVPLFETIDDLAHASEVMETLYKHPAYSRHLRFRGQRQTIMLGFSDGTKDGGYLMANWSIYKAKEALTALSRQYGIEVLFFDGRGGPPARGGGKTHKFYASMGKNISNKEIQLTIQGQTVSSNFGTVDSAQFNLEQLLHAGIYNDLLHPREGTLTKEEEALLQQLASEGYKAYIALKEHPSFLDYLSHASPLRWYSETNIGSRPAKRSGGKRLSLSDLRAIPFVASWSQMKQNVTGYYGVGYALEALEKAGKWSEIRNLYQHSSFFKTLIDNCEMAMLKSYFPLTAYLSGDPHYGEVWNKVYEEYERTRSYVFKLSGKQELMADYPVEQLSIQMRERIVLPLTTIQQYAMARIRGMEEGKAPSALKEEFEKLIIRCSFGIINAGRNSA
ncbi:phosphoenolpyruvate carboxylase type 1 [Dinghuibacter silviterrae]|uniref:Phosphoenolpyruvate carboxylase n=2 Tax=Dinghuibacter silviterrae TaxID=1539049 RepID=A0A4R8DUB3_9BACT|nr:phosphoenolpyruvate carboxylase type 1 [Dinghuibacter silviterrae]